ncbi:hypothetical protein A3C23_02980 [Candidatus Roizmanbacteria bacterium RIFCSPHIGHO2_02_FULL_37_13b]|uniref:FecR protein domain-containing protein n=1 Tax=Candidatus Roizmanbacteria bacterium RIFCSPLOWO2_02_FULL_36_11 TaxID=1802071 RepID=A0A1F7JI75_9BACT|nr:MAG: hypothetical protein A3C23_02980 [Candidatus Roizmanbacteria bacterium RIFCSPHIGHO2_02_FULL_37_13b]OGK55314.1 MAG: hypothetical protein A3H78_04410 [Candidatus Roizmanbacteria bacterium RIFCSPLOWO2_02_FULL_36_11]
MGKIKKIVFVLAVSFFISSQIDGSAFAREPGIESGFTLRSVPGPMIEGDYLGNMWRDLYKGASIVVKDNAFDTSYSSRYNLGPGTGDTNSSVHLKGTYDPETEMLNAQCEMTRELLYSSKGDKQNSVYTGTGSVKITNQDFGKTVNLQCKVDITYVESSRYRMGKSTWSDWKETKRETYPTVLNVTYQVDKTKSTEDSEAGDTNNENAEGKQDFSDLPDVEYQPDKDSGARFTSIQGEVKSYPDGNPEDISFPKFGIKIAPGTHIFTGEESSVTLTFADLSTYKVPPNSEIVIRSGDPKGPLSLTAGKIWGNIKKIASGESIEIRTNQAVTGIKGTTFVLEENNGKTVLKVIEGVVSFISQKTGGTQEVKTGESLSADVNGLGQKNTFDVAAEQASWDVLEKEARKSAPKLNNLVYVGLAVLVVIIIGTVLKFRKKKAGK